MNFGDLSNIDRASLDRQIRSVSRYYWGTLVAVIAIALSIYAIMQVVLDRHSSQQSISFLVSSQFIKFQQLTNTARALMRASTDTAVPVNVLDRLIEDMNQKIADVRDISAQLHLLHQRLGQDSAPSEFDLRLQSFLDRAEMLGKIDNISRRRRYSYWGPIDFAAASDGFIMRGFQDEIQQSFTKSEASITTAKHISALLILSLVVALLVVGGLILVPLLKKLRVEYEKKKVFEQQLSILAHRDGLTKLPNRMSFIKMLDQLVASRTADKEDSRNCPFVILLIDLDYFKEVNDTFGHPTGNGLLIEVAKRIASVVDADSMAARLSGDEFAVLAPNLSSDAQAEELAERIRESLFQPYLIDGHRLHISGSIGGAIFPDHGTNTADIIRCADLALYAAKAKRNHLTIFNEAMMADRLAESKLRAALFNAVENDEFLVYYQPKMDIRNGQHAGFEALVRWHHPELGILAPGRFLHLLDTASSITAMTEVVINKVARDIRIWRNAGLSYGCVAINMSEAVLISEVGYDMLADAVQRHSLDWSDFAIEITEDVFMNKYREQILATVVKLGEHGVSIALDDFGTGFASLTNLRNFQFDEVKIDRSFVSDIGIDSKSEQIIKAMISLVGNLGKNCVAEGVETQEQILFLQQAGCVIVQGYFFAQPQSFEMATRRLESGSFPFSASSPCDKAAQLLPAVPKIESLIAI
jgi:diguanylate cyclase (GGDEF)-like protein